MGWYEAYRTDEYIENLQAVVDGLRLKDEVIDKLRKENNELKDEHYKDEELQRLHGKIKQLQCDCNRGFSITLEEQKVIDELREKHKKVCPHCSFKYVFEPYSIVEFGYLKCTVCGDELKFMER